MEVVFKNASNVPRLGDERRTPNYSYPNWERLLDYWRELSDSLYKSEWEGGSPKQMQYVVQAITETGLGNFSQMLRDINARTVSKIVRGSSRRVNYLEPGAGVSTITVYRSLQERGIDPEKLYGTLIEPSKSRLDAMVEELAKMGLEPDKHFRPLVAKDTDVPDLVRNNSQDVVSCVAQIHHHAYLDRPLQALYHSLVNGGVILIADWHNSMWEHPARVYQMLKEDFEWPSKDEDLDAFAKAYPKALETPPALSEGDEEANRMIRAFWKSYGRIKAAAIERGEFDERDDILMLEAHRPVKRQVEDMRNVGFVLDSQYVRNLFSELKLDGNPYQILPDSRILMFTAGQKL